MSIADEFSFSHKLTVLPPAGEDALLVPVSSWDGYVRRIEDYPDKSERYLAIGWGCLGIAAGALMAAMAFPFSATFATEIKDAAGQIIAKEANVWAIATEISFVAITMASLAIGLITLWHGGQHSQDRSDLRRVVVEDMRGFERRCKRVPTSG